MTQHYFSQGPQHLWGNQRLSVNDCFLRNMHKYKYIANIDDDEIILPQNATSWPEMMEVVEKMSQNEVGIPRRLIHHPLLSKVTSA